MNAVFAFIVVLVLALLSYLVAAIGGQAGHTLLGVVIPYAAIVIFVGGVIWRILSWAKVPVPFRIPSTCGQQKSLPWIKESKLDNPSGTMGVIIRMALEVFTFRSLFRNTRASIVDQRVVYGPTIWLWGAALVFHYSLLVVFLRHFRLFMEPTPFFVPLIQYVDGFFELSIPVLYLSSLGLLAAAGYLFLRRIVIPQVRYISLVSDYIPLFLILGIASTGLLMQQFLKVNLHDVKALTAGLFSFSPYVPKDVNPLFYVHLSMVCLLISYFPFSKLTHMAGVFMSPTRNLANNNRMKHHTNPWNYPVKVHTYEEYEEEFHDVMKDAGMPLEKDVENV